MIQQTVTAIRDLIDAHLPTSLRLMPGADAAGLTRPVTVVETRHVLNMAQLEGVPIWVRVEAPDAVTVDWPLESVDTLPTLPIGITCALSRPDLPALEGEPDYDAVRAVRALCRAVEHALRSGFRASAVLDVEGVQVRAPTQVTYGEPEQGDDAALTIMTMGLAVPVLDYWAQSAGGV